LWLNTLFSNKQTNILKTITWHFFYTNSLFNSISITKSEFQIMKILTTIILSVFISNLSFAQEEISTNKLKGT
jgi:hypothetical protein